MVTDPQVKEIDCAAGRHGSRRRLSQVMAWLTVPLYIIGMGSTIWYEFQLGQEITLSNFLQAIGFGAFAVVGAILVKRRPENSISWIMISIALMISIFPAAETYATYILITGIPINALVLFGAWANDVYWIPLMALIFIYFPLLFPDGHLLSPRWRWVAAIALLSVIGFILLGAFRENLVGQNLEYQIDNPFGIAGIPAINGGLLSTILFLLAILSSVASIFIRFQRSKGVERQQLKWFLFAIALAPIIVAVDFLPIIGGVLGDILFGLVLIALPTAVGVAVLRYRLYDIDIIIRKTLVYAVLSGMLALVYFSMVILLQSLFDSFSGQESPIAIVISTLAIAALFGSLRSRIQDVIDRRFFRKKYDAQQVLARFAQTARDETDRDMLTAELLSVVQETMQPTAVNLWLSRQSSSIPQGDGQ